MHTPSTETIEQFGAELEQLRQETLAKVEGQRAPIAKLWAAYAKQQAS